MNCNVLYSTSDNISLYFHVTTNLSGNISAIKLVLEDSLFYIPRRRANILLWCFWIGSTMIELYQINITLIIACSLKKKKKKSFEYYTS